MLKEALFSKSISKFADYPTIQPEQKYGKNLRVDFLLTHIDQSNTYIEVKNVHLWRGDDWAEFPDTVTAGELKHLGGLGDMVEELGTGLCCCIVCNTQAVRASD